jgi:DNA-binding response OmpR family regulator
MLAGARVLLLEDDFFTALELAEEIEAAGGRVIGPYADVAVALRALESEPVDGAILDVHLADRDVTPVATLLVERGVPVVINSPGELPPSLAPLARRVHVILKPAHPSRAVAALCARLVPTD